MDDIDSEIQKAYQVFCLTNIFTFKKILDKFAK